MRGPTAVLLVPFKATKRSITQPSFLLIGRAGSVQVSFEFLLHFVVVTMFRMKVTRAKPRLPVSITNLAARAENIHAPKHVPTISQTLAFFDQKINKI